MCAQLLRCMKQGGVQICIVRPDPHSTCLLDVLVHSLNDLLHGGLALLQSLGQSGATRADEKYVGRREKCLLQLRRQGLHRGLILESVQHGGGHSSLHVHEPRALHVPVISRLLDWVLGHHLPAFEAEDPLAVILGLPLDVLHVVHGEKVFGMVPLYVGLHVDILDVFLVQQK